MIVCTANIGRTRMTAERVGQDMRKIKQVLPLGIIGWQEIDEGDEAHEHRIMRSVYGNSYQKVAMETRVPITVPDKFDVLRSKVTFAAQGIPHVSPVRVISEALIKVSESEKIVVLNMHYPAGAFNQKTEKTQEIREQRWHEMNQVHRQRLKYWADERGFTTFWMGDVNRMEMPKAHRDEQQLVTAGIDSISVIERELKVNVYRRGTIRLNSDHDARYVAMELK